MLFDNTLLFILYDKYITKMNKYISCLPIIKQFWYFKINRPSVIVIKQY